MQNQISIDTGRLTIRRMDRTDGEAFFRYRSLPEVCRYQFWHPETIDEVVTFLEKNEQIEPFIRLANGSNWRFACGTER